jgi:hypothetical protein
MTCEGHGGTQAASEVKDSRGGRIPVRPGNGGPPLTIFRENSGRLFNTERLKKTTGKVEVGIPLSSLNQS